MCRGRKRCAFTFWFPPSLVYQDDRHEERHCDDEWQADRASGKSGGGTPGSASRAPIAPAPLRILALRGLNNLEWQMERIDMRWESPGPVSSAFMRDRSEVSVLKGPVGSGKTTTVFMNVLGLASEQVVSPRRVLRPEGFGVRMFRVCV